MIGIRSLVLARIASALPATLGIFSFANGGLAQCQLQKVLASDTEQGDLFGSAVAIDGDWAIIAAPEEDDIAVQSGAVYLYHHEGASWVQSQRVKSGSPSFGGSFGYSVALSGDVAVIGAFLEPAAGFSAAGASYICERSGSTWVQTARLVAGDPGFDEHFGWSVAVSEDLVVIGARDGGFGSGAAYVFERAGGSWTQTEKLMATDFEWGDDFGHSVSVSQEQILIGAPGKDVSSETDQGTAYIFERSSPGWSAGPAWIQTEEFVASDGHDYDYFGWSVAISDSTAFVGATSHDHNVTQAGAAYVFTRIGSTWVESQELWSADLAFNDAFGFALSISGNTLLVAALDDNESGMGSGSAYAFRYTGASWVQTGKLLANDGSAQDLLGSAVGLSGTTAIIGAKLDDDVCPGDITCNSGSAYVFDLPPSAIQYGSCPSGSPCGNNDSHGGCFNSTMKGAILAASGSGSVLTDDLRIQVTHCPPNKLTLLFMGPSQSSAVYGDGIRVASPQNPIGIYRYGGAAADTQGMNVRGPGLVAYSQGFQPLGRIQSGQTWNFQIWYRDTQGPCGGLTNFSNGVQVTFGP